jgi:DNA-3-methyladenine glycosylase
MLNLKRLTANFYQQNSFNLAQKLLGCFLIRKLASGKTIIGKIVEVEVYFGPDDLASHASKGRTKRTELMFGPPGYAYIYLIYGMYNCLNIVTEKNNFPAAILIRSLEPIEGIKLMMSNRHLKHSQLVNKITNGPGKLCQALRINNKLNGLNLITSQELFIAKNPQLKIKPKDIISTKRIGIDYAKHYKNKPWRYYLKKNRFVSKK